MKIKLITFVLITIAFYSFAGQSVSLLQLIVNPEKFSGQKVVVIGYFDVSLDNALYISKDAAENFDFPSSIQVIDESENSEMTASCFGKYVQIEGKVEKNSDDYYQISSVNYILEISKRDYCWERNKEY